MERLLARIAAASLLFTALQLPAQDSYVFETTAAGVDAYAPLLDGTAVELFDEDGWHELNNAPGLPLWFFGENFSADGGSSVRIDRNGRVRIGNAYRFAELSVARTPLQPIDANSRVAYHHYPGPGGGILVIEYRHMRLVNGLNGNYMNAQIWYYANTGNIKFHYGPSSASNASGFFGDRGPHIGIFHSPTDMSGCLEKLWLSGNPDGPQVSYAANYDFTTLFGLPYAGTSFRFVPLFSIPIGMRELEQVSLRVGANVVEEELQLFVEEPSGLLIDIVDANGRTVRNARLAQGTNRLSVGELVPGAYFIRSERGAVLRFAKV